MEALVLVFMFLILSNADEINEIEEMLAAGNESVPLLYPTRRILRGTEVGETRPYMVYLRPAPHVEKKLIESHWLCGGVIIHERYVLTSAACIEDAKHFYVISGTHTWVPPEVTNNECINNGAKKAVWKCVPKSYFFDGDDFDNIRWMVGDIAIVKVEDDFNFERRIRGCDFIPKKVEYNNHSIQLEKSATLASVAGWGTTDRFVETDFTAPLRSAANSVELLETDVIVISKKSCRKRWDERYHFIINDEMICTKDSADDEPMSAACACEVQDREVSCKGLDLSEEDYYDDNEDPAPAPRRRMIIDPRELQVHTAAHRDARRKNLMQFGGFCENDHGGPLVVGRGKSSVVIGIMSACHTKEIDMKCYGPFLFTSVFKYRSLISCAINKNTEATCRRLLSSSKTHIKETSFTWPTYPESPALRNDDKEKKIARMFEVPSASEEIRPPRPTQPPPPPTTPTTPKPSPIRSTAPPPLDSDEQEFRHNEKKKKPQEIKKSFDTLVPQARPPKLIEYDLNNNNKKSEPKPLKMPSWLTAKKPVPLGQAKDKDQPAESDDSGEFSSIKKVIMRRFFME